MHNVLLYTPFFIDVFALIFTLYGCGRVEKVNQAKKDLYRYPISNFEGDLATPKKTIQSLNNRINGMHSPKIAEQELLMQLMQNKGQQQNGKMVGG